MILLPLRFVPGRPGPWRGLVLAGFVALAASACHVRATGEVTASLASTKTAGDDQDWRALAETWGNRFEANPADPHAAMNYARALRETDQRAQAAAVLQQAAIRNPKNLDVLAAYGKALAEAGRYKEADEVLGRAHSPERPDWRILSAQGAVADQIGDHALAQRYYDSALKIAPGEPTVLSNLGLSHALSKRLPEAEQALREAHAHPNADPRVRQNLALILGLQGKFQDAEAVLRRDLPAHEVAANLAAIRQMVSQPNTWTSGSNGAKAAGVTARTRKTGPDNKLELRRF